ncbi:MAG: 16S rRNA (uracil(1498)-N(3))-methyltransferase [Oscillospiraceae bacterium]|nr:16S rRNA (uracil(1498)-N(3))-methyltransferase [Oscillospiraceae bacterium]
MARFFMAGTNLTGGPTAIIRGRDAEHLQVLRIRPGEEVTVCDTEGTDYKCRVIRADREEAELEVIETTPCRGEPDVAVTVLAGLPKGERTDWLIQKCVEAGASELFFFQASRSIAKPDNPVKKLERWNRISEEAAKQSGRGKIPRVDWAADYGVVLNTAVHTDLPLFLYETGEREPLRAVLEAAGTIRSAAVITGPEGGFEPFEAQLAKLSGLHICSMGERILRCETAPVVAVTALMYATGNLS